MGNSMLDYYFLYGIDASNLGEQYYFLGPVFILLLLLAGTMTFTHVILRKVLGMEKWTGLGSTGSDYSGSLYVYLFRTEWLLLV